MLDALWSRLRTKRGPASLALGSLEKSVMEYVWRRETCTVRDLHEDFGGKFAYTTLMTTLDRLHKKGLLARHKDGKAFVYRPKLTKEELDRTVMREVIGAMVQDNHRGQRLPILSCFLDAITEEDEQMLSELEEEIKKRRNGYKRSE